MVGARGALVFLWLLVIRPLGDALDRARQRHGAAVLALAEARARRAPAGGVCQRDAALAARRLRQPRRGRGRLRRRAGDGAAGRAGASLTHRRGPAAGLVGLDRPARGAGRRGRDAARARQSGSDDRGRGGVQRAERAMSFRLPFGRGAFFVAVFAFALVALFPLGLAIRWLGAGRSRSRGAGGEWQRLARRAQGGATGPRADRRRQRAAEQPALASRPGAGSAWPAPTRRNPFEGAATMSRTASASTT